MKPLVIAIFFIGFWACGAFGQEAKLMLPIGHTNIVSWAAFSSDDQKVVTTSWDKTAKIWDTNNGNLLVELKGETDYINFAAFSPDNKRIVTSTNNNVKIWDATTGNLITNLYYGWAEFAAISPDGKKVVTVYEKPLFTASNLQNNDPDIAADDLHLNHLLDNQLNEISARGENNSITYMPGSNSPDAYSLGGRYVVTGDVLTVKANIRQNDVTKYKFELTGTKAGMKTLAEKVVSQATDWILKSK